MNSPLSDPGAPDSPEPAPRRTRRGAVVVGPTLWARWGPGALLGLPLVALLLSPFAGAGLQQWRRSRLLAGHDGTIEALLADSWVQLLLGALLLWAVFAAWALVPMLATHQVVLFDEDAETLILRRGVRTVDRAPLDAVVHAIGDAERGRTGEIALRAGDGGEPRHWTLPEVGWDGPSFDGLRVLQAAADLRAAPDRAALVHEARRMRREGVNRELAARAGMPWLPEYGQDEAAFQAEFDRVRRVLGGKEPAREGDPRP